MVLRHDAAGVLAVGQPAHAWLCGQFALAWGNARFGAVSPLPEVTLGAEQHDVAWLEWELAPELNPETGLPVTFSEMAPQDSAELWRHGPERLISQSRYAALLATIHGRRLSELRNLDALSAGAAEVVRTLREESSSREAALLATLRADPATEAAATAEIVARNSNLLWTWDGLSLGLLLDWAPHTFRSVPTESGGVVDVELRAVPGRAGLPTLSLSPWPFRDPAAVEVSTEGRRLTGRYATQAELDAALASAPWETVGFALVPAV